MYHSIVESLSSVQLRHLRTTVSPQIFYFPLPKSPPRNLPLLTSVPASHLTALGDDNVEVRDILAAVARLCVLHLAHNVHAVNDLAEDDVLAVQEGSGHRGDEELRSVGVGACVLSDGTALAVSFPYRGKSIPLKADLPPWIAAPVDRASRSSSRPQTTWCHRYMLSPYRLRGGSHHPGT